MVIDAFLSTAATVSALLRSPLVAEKWDEPSVLPEFRVGPLAGHLARAVFTTEGYLTAEMPPGATMTDAVGYLSMLWTLTAQDNAQIVERGSVDAGTGQEDLVARYDAAVARLATALPALPEQRPMPMRAGLVLPLRDCLTTRLLELLVHADDLALSLGVPTPDFDDEAADLVVALLARFARRRHGTPALLRAFTRAERAPSSVAAF
ncbi:maleylpyruvate isomerase N-terminal domain-containing protein [Actinoplanes sp. NPDC051633]|uniref:maleylpyruvate isomerase N-terminal domain-containing protein n=1 Tax=Actinoplanes sp. NPDC051633 TaxID=3155670 RepID=UPI0034434081